MPQATSSKGKGKGATREKKGQRSQWAKPQRMPKEEAKALTDANNAALAVRQRYSLCIRTAQKQQQSPQVYSNNVSVQRLMREGLHPKVTTLSFEVYVARWDNAQVSLAKPCWEGDVLSACRAKRHVFSAPLIMSRTFIEAKIEDLMKPSTHKLLVLLSDESIGPEILEAGFANSLIRLHNLAVSSMATWNAVTKNLRVHNFLTGACDRPGRSGILVVVCPEYTNELVLQGETANPAYSHVEEFEKNIWWDLAIHERAYMPEDLRKCVREILRYSERMALSGYRAARWVDDETCEVLRAIASERKIHPEEAQHHYLSQPERPFEFTYMFLGYRMRKLLSDIFDKRLTLKALHFDGVPLLDRRLLAIIIRSCPNVTSMGVYNCPLLHYGDLISILDLIWEVNQTRLAAQKITSLDFFPAFWRGTQFPSDNRCPYTDRTMPSSAMYGVSWDRLPFDLSHHGFNLVLIQAFFKASNMGIETLFDEDSGLRRFLAMVPRPFLDVPYLLDAMYRMTEATPGRKGDRQRKEATFDLIKAQTMRFAEPKYEELDFFDVGMDKQAMFFCRSCGYQSLEGFWPAKYVDAGVAHRICCGCYLRATLDEETHHLLAEKRHSLDELLPEHQKMAFNEDAPLHPSALGVLHLKSIHATPGPGHMERDQVRGLKLVKDSLQGLPSLEELLQQGDLWDDELDLRLRRLDLFRTAAEELVAVNETAPTKLTRELCAKHCPRGKPDHAEERQIPSAHGADDLHSARGEFARQIKHQLHPGEAYDYFQKDKWDDWEAEHYPSPESSFW